MFQTAKDKLIETASRLKKAWLLGVAMVGAARFERFGYKERVVPSYRDWTRRDLETHVEHLRGDFLAVLGMVFRSSDSCRVASAAHWMAGRYDAWEKAGCGIFTLCSAHSLETELGELKHRDLMEVPPYAELLLQGWHGMAIRHPEYMLARDLTLLFNLFHDADEVLNRVNWSSPPEWACFGSENHQALARSTIQACFNLLESFVSGLARGHVMKNQAVDEQIKKRLLDTERPLKSRLVYVPEQIAGRACGLDVNKPPLGELFGPIKQRRDTFVHCEPGPQTSYRGYVKEVLFHDVSSAIVRNAVELTLATIRHLWNFLCEKDGPRWLPSIQSDGRFPPKNMRLVPPSVEATSA